MVFLLDLSYQLLRQSCSTSLQYSPSTSCIPAGQDVGPAALAWSAVAVSAGAEAGADAGAGADADADAGAGADAEAAAGACGGWTGSGGAAEQAAASVRARTG